MQGAKMTGFSIYTMARDAGATLGQGGRSLGRALLVINKCRPITKRQRNFEKRS